jgi:hypothetical protein
MLTSKPELLGLGHKSPPTWAFAVKEGPVETPRGIFERSAGEDDVAGRATGDSDEQESRADQREAVLDAREVRADAREAAEADRRERALHILADAEERDGQADARDAAATTRDTAAGLHSFLHDVEHDYGPALKARRSAAMDRTESKTDRASAAIDRSKLTEDDSTPSELDKG